MLANLLQAPLALLVPLLLAVYPISAQETTSSAGPSGRDSWAPYRTIYQFPNTTFVENIAVRPNNDLLVGIIYTPELWSINPSTSAATLIYNFTAAPPGGVSQNAVLGIAEISPDVFAVVTSSTNRAPPLLNRGTSTIWRVDLTSHRQNTYGGSSSSSNNRPGPRVSLVTRVPEAGALNGLTALPGNPSTVLAADTADGVIWRIDTRTGAHSVALRDTRLTPPGTGPFADFGVNGVRVVPRPDKNNSPPGREAILYFTNTGRQLLGRVAISPTTGAAQGPFSTIANTLLVDDFAVDERGTAYVTEESTVTRYTAQGQAKVVVGNVNSTAVVGSTSAQFGRRGTRLERTLFVTTNGGLIQPINGTYIEGGKVVAVDVGRWEGRP